MQTIPVISLLSHLFVISYSISCDNNDAELYKCWDNNGNFELSPDDNCTLLEWKCDNIADCPYGDDEWNCPNYETCVNSTDSFGNPTGFPCDDNTCIYYSWSCLDNDFITWDCPNQQDVSQSICQQNPLYIDCADDPTKFKCDNTNGRCIDQTQVCDGINDCLDAQDESNILCNVPSSTPTTLLPTQIDDVTHDTMTTDTVDTTDSTQSTQTPQTTQSVDNPQTSFQSITSTTTKTSTSSESIISSTATSTNEINPTNTPSYPHMYPTTHHPVASSGTVRDAETSTTTEEPITSTTMPTSVDSIPSTTNTVIDMVTTETVLNTEDIGSTEIVSDTTKTDVIDSIDSDEQRQNNNKGGDNDDITTIIWVTVVCLVFVIIVLLAVRYFVMKGKGSEGRGKHSRISSDDVGNGDMTNIGGTVYAGDGKEGSVSRSEEDPLAINDQKRKTGQQIMIDDD